MKLFDVSPIEQALAPLLSFTYPTISTTPAILIQMPSERATYKSALDTALGDIEETRISVARLEEMVARLHSDLRRREAAVKEALAPVTGMPTEILQDIFLIVLACAEGRPSDTSITLSHVSSRWCHVSLGLWELWSTARLTQRLPDMLQTFASRSGNLRLDVSALPVSIPLDFGPDFDIARISSLAIGVGDSRSSRKLLSSIETRASDVNLDSLLLSSPAHGQSVTFKMDKYPGLQTARTLTLEGVTFLWHDWRPWLTMNRLERLTISRCQDANVTQIIGALKDAPLLETVELDSIYHLDRNASLDAYPYTDQIRTFKLTECPWPVWIKVLSEWTMPQLVSLTVDLNLLDARDGISDFSFFHNNLCIPVSRLHRFVLVRPIHSISRTVSWLFEPRDR